MFRAMKPETIERRARERAIRVAESRQVLIARLKAKVVEHGADSIYAEMLAETERSNDP